MNPKINLLSDKKLAGKRYSFREVNFDYIEEDKPTINQTREIFDRGNGVAVLLYNREKKSVVLTRQFRLAAFLNGTPDGMLIEACAGTLDEVDPMACMIRETREETGYHIENAQKVLEVYVSPGAVTERLYLYLAEYTPEMKKSEGGGLEEENERIQVLEIPFSEAVEMVKNGQIRDAKTILLIQYALLHKIID